VNPIRTRARLIGFGVPVLAVLLPGCSPELHGQAGITVTDDGRVMAIVSMCGDYEADGFGLYALRDASDEPVRAWTPRKPLGNTIEIDLLGDADREVWRSVSGTLSELDPAERHQFDGGEHDRSAMVGRVSFTAPDVESLRPQEVFRGGSSDGDDDHREIVSMQEFTSNECD
jgi:hypothetical protein